jgi:hypothetical protein
MVHRIESAVASNRSNSGPLSGLPGVRPVGKRSLPVKLEHQHAAALLECGDGDRGGRRALAAAALLRDERKIGEF